MKMGFVGEEEVFEVVAVKIEKVEGSGFDGGKRDARGELKVGVFPGFRFLLKRLDDRFSLAFHKALFRAVVVEVAGGN